jgi:hypothetical protein
MSLYEINIRLIKEAKMNEREREREGGYEAKNLAMIVLQNSMRN